LAPNCDDRDVTRPLVEISRALSDVVDALRFPSVAVVYNPLVYARAPHEAYLERYGAKRPREVLMVGMNPGPFGMAQTGVPFGDVAMVRDFLGIEGPVGKPPAEHPRRPIAGFACHRSEVSGTRFWGWARDRFGTAERFFDRVFVANWCPLVFMEDSGRNRPPDKLPAAERVPLFEACNDALTRVGRGRRSEAMSSSAASCTRARPVPPATETGPARSTRSCALSASSRRRRRPRVASGRCAVRRASS
jgi:single-strand selective monofunctional uracil DNA glycosylase